MTADERRVSRLRHDAKLMGWAIIRLADQIVCRHERGATLSWPWPRTDAHEQTLLTVLRQPVPRTPEAETAEREMQRRRAEVREFYQAKMGGQRLDR